MPTTKDMPQRRPERQLTAEQTFEVIEAADYGFLSTADDAGIPYGMPITPVFLNGAFYFHSVEQTQGRRNTNLKANPNVSLCFVAKAITMPEWYSVDFASAIVRGKASLVTDPTERAQAMMAIVRRYAPKNSPERNAAQLQERFALASLWRIDVEKITGKARAAKKWVKGETVREYTETEPSPWLVNIK